MNTVVSVSVSVSAETETFFRFRYRFRPKRKMAVSAIFGFGRNEKKPFGRTLSFSSVNHTKISVSAEMKKAFQSCTK